MHQRGSLEMHEQDLKADGIGVSKHLRMGCRSGYTDFMERDFLFLNNIIVLNPLCRFSWEGQQR